MATLDTGHYSFMAAGQSDQDAREHLRRAWEHHAALTGASYTWAYLAEDVNVLVLTSGTTLRDGEPFPVGEHDGDDRETLHGRPVVLTTHSGWVFESDGEPLSADQVEEMGRDPGLRDT